MEKWEPTRWIGQWKKSPATVSRVLWLLVLVAWSVGVPNVFGSVVLDVDSVITGGYPASSQAPWLEATFETQSGKNLVALTLTAPHLTSREDVDLWLFNVDPRITQAQLDTLTIASKTRLAGQFDLEGISLFKATEDGVVRAGSRFDFALRLPTGPQSKRFTEGDAVKLLLTMTVPAGTLTADSFDFADPSGMYFTAAHVQQTTAGGSDSGWIGTGPRFDPPVVVPEVSGCWMGGLLLIAFGVVSFRSLRAVRIRATS